MKLKIRNRPEIQLRIKGCPWDEAIFREILKNNEPLYLIIEFGDGKFSENPHKKKRVVLVSCAPNFP